METKFASLPRHCFPIVVQALDKRGKVVWERTVEGPGPLYVPFLAGKHGPIAMRVHFADGTMEEAPAPTSH